MNLGCAWWFLPCQAACRSCRMHLFGHICFQFLFDSKYISSMYFNKFLTLYLFFSIWKGIQRFDGQGWICSPGQKSCQDLAKGRAVHRDEILGWEIQATAWSLHSEHAALHTILSKSRLHTSHHSPDWTCQCLAKCRIKPTESYRIFLLIMILWFFLAERYE